MTYNTAPGSLGSTLAMLQPFYGYAAALDRRCPSLLRFRPRGAKDWNDLLHPSLPQLATTAVCWTPPLPHFLLQRRIYLKQGIPSCRNNLRTTYGSIRNRTAGSSFFG